MNAGKCHKMVPVNGRYECKFCGIVANKLEFKKVLLHSRCRARMRRRVKP